MLRRQLLYTMVLLAKHLYPLVKEHIRGSYGAGGPEGGPYSYKGYLEAMLSPATFGDHVMLVAFSITFNARVTVLMGSYDPIQEIRIRHSRPLVEEPDVVVVFDGVGHYSAVGESTLR